MSDVYLDFRTVDYGINSTRKILKVPNLFNERFMISLSVHKRIWMLINNINYITDNGLFFNLNEEETFFQFSNVRYDNDLRINNNETTFKDTFIAFTISSTGNTLFYNRKFFLNSRL